MKHDIEAMLKALQIAWNSPVGEITLTATMLNKSIIDANKTIAAVAEFIGVNYAELKAGEKVQIAGRFIEDNSPCIVTFYRTKNRGDKRLSITGLKARAAIGDTIGLAHDINGALVINATKQAGDVYPNPQT